MCGLCATTSVYMAGTCVTQPSGVASFICPRTSNVFHGNSKMNSYVNKVNFYTSGKLIYTCSNIAHGKKKTDFQSWCESLLKPYALGNGSNSEAKAYPYQTAPAANGSGALFKHPRKLPPKQQRDARQRIVAENSNRRHINCQNRIKPKDCSPWKLTTYSPLTLTHPKLP
jgi:hypothetical protein